MTNSPELCKECGGNCCRHPTMTDIEFERLVDAIGKEEAATAMPERFGTWWMFRENCPGKQKDGCVLAYDDRPLCCKIYPFVAIPAVTGSVIGHEILLDIRYCPRWKEFGEWYEETKQEFIIQKSCAGEIPQPLEKRGWKIFFRLS
ncbi:MAG: YkgJ family cysteine cluster protein [Methanomicrobiales archaeon]